MGGLVPGIVQHAGTGEVLMLGFLNRQSYDHTLSTGFVTFFSRTRNKLWMKGETSGNRLRIVSAPAPTATPTPCSSASPSMATAWSATKAP